MKHSVLHLIILLSFIYMWQPKESAASLPQITSPRSGDVIQGMVPVAGNTNVENLDYFLITFSYEESDTLTWFKIQESREAIQNGTLAIWDTTTITDGTYRLKLEVFLKSGEREEDVITGLKIRNYTPIETQTSPTLEENAQMDAPTAVSATIPSFNRSTPTLLPENPAQISSSVFRLSLLGGIIASAIGMGLLGAYIWIKKRIRR